MDDILSAALGQSGLNLSFLEEQQADGSGTTGVSNSAQTVPTALQSQFSVEQIQQSVKEDVEDDVTELLNLLENEPANISSNPSGDKSSNTDGSEITSNKDSEVDMLDFLLKYQSDDDDDEIDSVGSPGPPINIVTTMVTSQVNKIKTKSTESSVVLGSKNNKQQINISSKFPKISNNSPVLGLDKTTAISSSKKVILPSVTMLNNKLFISNSNTSTKKVITNSIPSPTPTNKLNQNQKSSKNLSDDEKRKLSIQHVLASPNLTYREKQFLMKSALSANIKPSHPAMSSTIK